MVNRKIVQWCSAFVCNIHVAGFLTGHIYQGSTKAVCLPGLNCYSCPGAIGACPVGALQSALSGTVLRFPFYVLGTFLAFGLFFGRFVCGWLCPFGLVQEILFLAPVRKLKKSHFTARLCYLKYLLGIGLVLLVPVLLYAYQGIGEPAFCEYFCPAGTLEAAVPLLSMNDTLWAAAGWLTAWKFFILFVFWVSMIFVYRPFCRFACPLGAWYGRFNRQAALGIAVDAQHCTKCGRCAAVCRMDVKIAGDPECISCGACRPICPEHAVYFRKLWQGKNIAEVNKN